MSRGGMFILRLFRLIRSRLLYKMVLIYSLLTLIPLTLVSGTFYYRSSTILKERIVESNAQTLEETKNKIDTILKAFSEKLLNLSSQRPLVTILRHDAFPDQFPLQPAERAFIEKGISETLHVELTNMNKEIGDYADAIYLINSKNRIYTSDGLSTVQYFEALHLMPFERLGTPEWAFYLDRGRMVCAMKMVDPQTGQEVGILSLMLHSEKIRKLYASYPKDSFYILNGSNMILSADDPKKIKDIFISPYAKSQWITKIQASNEANYKYVSLIQTSDISKAIRGQALFAAVVTIVSWIIVVIITYAILRKITNPIRTLTRLMRSAEREQYQLVKDIKSSDEIAILCHSFNGLISETRDLIQKVYKTEILQKEAELKAIRTYINPHFLYNTLEHISILSKDPVRVAHIPEVVKQIATILRISISPSAPMVTLETEIEFSRLYILIHQYRYGDRLQYRIDLEPHLRKVTVPKLILQPIIENAFVHGIDGNQEGGWVEVRVYEKNFNMILEVENSGENPQLKTEPKGFGTGLNMVRARLAHHYGASSALELIHLARGTLVRLQLPILLPDSESEAEQNEA
ncbi:sensor histidine kinase [Cohnella silvisoli]|uniref:Histidine kinase n=1 Tax=Cohnella silvisoli TaxID=2873699 RepID=A0ABV1L423_9BACL|nr:histidine kinase [Cohnella silvisoli]MCD9026415.1 histidine kinase [Cohnella silvisoli]